MGLLPIQSEWWFWGDSLLIMAHKALVYPRIGGLISYSGPHHQRGGATLLRDALLRIDHASETVGIRAVLVQAINPAAREFYLHYGFSPSPVDDLRLMLLLKDLRKLLRAK